MSSFALFVLLWGVAIVVLLVAWKLVVASRARETFLVSVDPMAQNNPSASTETERSLRQSA